MVLIKRFLQVLVGTISLVYFVFALFLWYNEYREGKLVSSLKSVYSRKKTPHQVILLKNGLASFEKRLEAIRQAKKSIELEFFIYELDLSSRLLTYQLIEAAKRGVQVKILVDFSVSVFKLAPRYAAELAEHGIQVKYYNTASNSRFVSIQHRNHRKLLIVDAEMVFIGGRNIGDDYFDLSNRYNFLDTDIQVRGEIVDDIRQSFFAYWESEYAERPSIEKSNEKSFFVLSSEMRSLLSFLAESKDKIETLNFETICNDIAYVTDHPGIMSSNRQVFKRLKLIIEQTQSQILVESPYLVLRPDGLNLIRSATDRGIEVSILTNSLASTDAFYTVGALVLSAKEIERSKVKLFAFRKTGSPYPLAKQTPYGLHSKRAVIDEKHSLIGTYNIDPRSANLNSEVMVICRDNSELAKAMISDIKGRQELSTEVFQEESTFSALISGAKFSDQFKMLATLPLVYLFDFLL